MEERESIRAVGYALHRERRNRKMTVDEVSALCGLSNSTVNRIENGVIDGRLSTVSRIAKVFGLKLTLTGEE
ncbi:MAG: helix-turn-helix domain-containing protein [Bacteroidales bacterium]